MKIRDTADCNTVQKCFAVFYHLVVYAGEKREIAKIMTVVAAMVMAMAYGIEVRGMRKRERANERL